jgi:transcriptional regulator with XRE-family HTH domain
MMTPEEALAQTGSNLRQIRTAKMWYIEALAVLSQLDAELIEGIECGNVDYFVSDIFALAAALNVDFRRIMVDNVTI